MNDKFLYTVNYFTGFYIFKNISLGLERMTT